MCNIKRLFHFAVFMTTLPELTGAAVPHIKRSVSVPSQTLLQMSHLHCHKPDQKDLSKSTVFGCKKDLSLLTGTATLILYIQTHSVL